MTENTDKKILGVKNLRVEFQLKKSFLKDISGNKSTTLKAVDGISFSVYEQEILSLVGESGSGKTTTGKALLGLVDSTGDKMEFYGEHIRFDDRKYMKEFRQNAQMIFQDPYQSLNPRNRIIDIVAEPLDINGLIKTEQEREQKVREALEQAGLSPGDDFFYRYPYELSGGQRQRVVIASSMIMNPKFVVADEPVSMLDASIRIGILKLMMAFREKMGVSYLFITHDLSLAWLISDRIAIMYLGKIVEIGSADIIINKGFHPYTRALMKIMPKPGRKLTEKREVLKGETPDPTDIPSGCSFRTRCPFAMDICKNIEPEMTEIEEGHFAACHLSEEK